MQHKYLAIDIGASSGRAIVITKNDNGLSLDECHRFFHAPYTQDGKMYWDFNKLLYEVKKGIQFSFEKHPEIKSIGIDTWGVDYGYIDQHGKLLRDPRSYRDQLFIKSMNDFHNESSFKELYFKTGIQQLPFNTIYQLNHALTDEIELLNQATHVVLLPNLIGYHLTNVLATEITNASTTSLLDARTKDWIKKYDQIDPIVHKFPKLVKPNSLLGHLVMVDGVPPVPVINVCSHDTASAFASILLEDNQVIINSGTWSLIGINLDKPKINMLSLEHNFTNELGLKNKVRFLKNVMGMFIINEIKRDLLEQGLDLSYFDIERKVLSANPFQAFIDPDYHVFHEPGQMIEKIKNYLMKTNQYLPKNNGELFRIVYESLVFKYRYTLDSMEQIIKKPIETLVIIGGASQSKFLNQMTADYTNRTVYTGPKEATVLGNGLSQMLYFKDVKTIKSGTTLIRKSFKSDTYYGSGYPDYYDEAYQNFVKILKVETDKYEK